MNTIVDRGYVSRSGRQLVPTFLGIAVSDLLGQHFGDLVDPDFTADMEDQLDQIARGESKSVEHLNAFYFGRDGEGGLKDRVADKINTIPFWALDLTPDGFTLADDPDADVPPDHIQIRVRGGAAFLRRGAGDQARTAPVPDDIAPADLTFEHARNLIDDALQLPRTLGRHPDDEEEREVTLLNGRFGPFVQLGETPPRGKAGKGMPQPRRASVPKDMELADVTLEHAIEWLRWPKTLGCHPDNGDEVMVRPGRWGPYVQCGDERRNLDKTDDLETVTLERALELLAQPRKSRGRRGRASGGRRSRS